MLSSPPFSASEQLCPDFDKQVTGEIGKATEKPPILEIPRQLGLPLHSSVRDVHKFLYKEFYATDLENVAPRLWVMSTQSRANINPLHRQKVKGREIIVTEDPRLHLVWIHDRIFIKPLPRYLLSHWFWETYLTPKSGSLSSDQELVQRAATGYLRTYCYLLQHQSDFTIAKQDHLRLIPEDVEWPEFCRFISRFDEIEDAQVSERYHYGELRLARLNFYAPLFFRRLNYERLHGEYSDYFARLYGPVLFLFAIASTLLNSMQVEMAVQEVSGAQRGTILAIFRGVSSLILVVTTLVALYFWSLWLWMILDEWIYAIKCRRRKSQERRSISSC